MHAVILILALASDRARTTIEKPSSEEIDPVAITVKKMEPPIALHDVRERAFEKLEQQLQVRAEELARNRALWDSLKIANYEYTIDFEGGWIDPLPMRVVVRDGVLESVSRQPCANLATAPEPCTTQRENGELDVIAATVPSLFDSIAATLSSARDNREPRNLQVSLIFDSTYGIPTRFVFVDSTIHDAGTGYIITGFVMIQ